MSVTVTVHEGEMKQIAHFIENSKGKTANGRLYGLWTHSNQPVIQYVVGDAKGDRDKIKDHLEANHSLRLVGYWSTSDDDFDNVDSTSLSFVKMTVNWARDKKMLKVPKLVVTQKSTRHGKNLDGVIETLGGDSAFRLPRNGPFEQGSKLERFHSSSKSAVYDRFDVEGPPRKSNEVETKLEQWYSNEDGMALFGKIHAELQKQFQITGTSRNTETHDLTVTFNYRGRQFVLNFPSNFPRETAILSEGKNWKPKKIELKEEKSEGKDSKKDQQRGNTSMGTRDRGDAKKGNQTGSQQQGQRKEVDKEEPEDAPMESDHDEEETGGKEPAPGSSSLPPQEKGDIKENKKNQQQSQTSKETKGKSNTPTKSGNDNAQTGGDEPVTEGSTVQNDEVSQQQIDTVKVPELLVQGICRVANITPQLFV